MESARTQAKSSSTEFPDNFGIMHHDDLPDVSPEGLPGIPKEDYHEESAHDLGYNCVK